jgi:SEC-C motif
MVLKINKKSSCPCGSGKRYEQCCRRKILLVKKAKAIFKEKEERRRQFVEQYGEIRMPQMIEACGSKLTTVGGAIYKQTRLGNYTFLHAVHDYALLFFGESYLKSQESLPMEKRHPALQWMYIYVQNTQEENSKPIGAGAAWLRFAYDIHTISDNAKLEGKLKERIIRYRSFQTSRHELWTAALFITAGFDIDFEDESDSSTKHPEFIAIDRDTGIKIAVEAKCRQRKGILGFSDGKDTEPGEEVGISKLLKKAYKKESGLPLCIVLNTNLPPENKNWNLEYWLNQIDQTFRQLDNEGYDNPCPANLVLFYNDPSHYMLKDEIGRRNDNLWLSDYFPVSAKNSCEVMGQIRLRLLKAQKQRLHPPVEIPDIY